MNVIIRHIEYLISRKDCVIIPDFGAILAKNIPASYDPISCMITPPSRIYSFNSDLSHNDGMLIASIQRAEGISYDSAAHKVKAAVEALYSQLKLSGDITLGRIGTLAIDDAGLISFTPNSDNALNTRSIWLKPIMAKPLQSEEINIVEAPIQKRESYTFKRIIKTAASIAILICIGFVASTPVVVDEATLASLAPEITQVAPEELLPPKEKEETLTVTLPAPGADSRIDYTEPEIIVPQAGAVTKAEDRQGQVTYYVIVASFPTISDSQKFIDMHDDALCILDSGKNKRVYTSAHPNAQDAYQAAKNAAKTYPDAWVCKQ